MILVNKATTQTPITNGRTGKQTVRLIPAPRVYIGPPNTASHPQTFFGPSNGVTPAGFTDLGIVDGIAKVTLDRSTTDVFIGVNKLLVGAYVNSTRAQIDFSLSQFDDAALETVTGIVPDAYVLNQYSRYLVGMEPMLQVGLLLVVQGKLDGKEFHFYNPVALMRFNFSNSSDSMSLAVTGILPGFRGTGSNSNQILAMTVATPSAPFTPPPAEFDLFVNGDWVGKRTGRTKVNGVSL